jgi:beta-1,4-N-acetylglucosaminyltransferase
MIFVTVGTHFQGFERLVNAMDCLASNVEEKVVIQYGCSKYIPSYAEGFAYTTSSEMEKLVDQARVVVTHAAAGAIILALNLNKPLVIVPRKKHFHEHADDHQIQLAKALDEFGQALTVIDPSPQSLQYAINHAGEIKSIISGPDHLVASLQMQLYQWFKER